MVNSKHPFPGRSPALPLALRLRLLSLGVLLLGMAARSTVGLAAGTDPMPPAYAPPPGRLAHWDFDAPGFTLPDGQTPTSGGQLPAGPGWDGAAPFFSRPDAPGVLQFRVAGPGGRPRLALAGGVRFLYRPSWSSGGFANTPEYAWGQGPGGWIRLLELSDTSTGKPIPVLAVSVDPVGTNLVVQARDRRGVWRTNYQASISWLRMQPNLRRNQPSPWHEVAVSYSPSNTVLVVDGTQVQDWSNKAVAGEGVALASRADPLVLTFGSDAAGGTPAEGWIDEVETFDRAIAPPDLYQFREPTFLSAAVSTAPRSVTLRWFGVSGEPVAIKRRVFGQTNWVGLTNRYLAMSYTDTSPALEVGQTYEYEVGSRLALVALQGRPVEQRGRVILLVEQGVARPLAAELDQLRADLAGDGWTVLRHDVPRHDYDGWNQQAINPAYVNNLQRVKQFILADHAAAPDATRAVFLIGHVTIPYSGVAYEDGHFDMSGAWPADAWYGDVDGVWSDQAMNTGANIANPIRRNVPGDGKLDASTFREHIATPSGTNGVELAVGRIDFARLPAFGAKTEVELLRQYLQKSHRYRLKQLRFDHTARVGSYFYSAFSPVGRALNLNALLLASRLEGLADLTHGDAFQPAGSQLWALPGGYGSYDTLHSARDAATAQGVAPVTAAGLASGQIKARTGFYLTKGSYFGDWNNYQNDLLKSLLALPDSGLAAFWTYDTLWRFESLGIGGTLGEGFVRTARGNASTRTTFQLGDPTLRAVVTAPPAKASARANGGAAEVRWEASPDANAGYLVFRSTAGPDGPFEKITPTAVTGATFTDRAAPGGRKLYQVRAAQLVTTGSGSFTNLSQAAYAPVD
jgi:hypothetical protein